LVLTVFLGIYIESVAKMSVMISIMFSRNSSGLSRTPSGMSKNLPPCPSLLQARFLNFNSIKLVPDRQPPLSQIMSSPKKFAFPRLPCSTQSINDLINFIWLSGSFSNFGNDHVCVEAANKPGRECERRGGVRTAEGDDTVF
jgi:hypothetical protein